MPHARADEAVRPNTSRELEQFELLSRLTGEPVARLCARWREPSLSVHGLQVSGPGSAYSLQRVPLGKCADGAQTQPSSPRA